MVYKKYIKRGGKVYGPYVYHSKRVDGKVISEYHGTHKKIDYKKFIWIFLGIAFVLLFAFGLSFVGKNISGKAVMDINAQYKQGEALDGVLKLSLKQGELLPASSKLIFKGTDQIYEYFLSDVLSETSVEGDFYIEGEEISGSGSGYGKEGVKEAYSIVYFSLDIYSEEETIEEEVVEEVVAPKGVPSVEGDINTEGKEVEVIDEIDEEEVKEVPEESVEEVEASEELGGQSPITGNLILELNTEIKGEISAGNVFEYELNKGQTAKLKPKSVRTDSESLLDNVLDIKIEGNKIIVTTDYFEDEKGFGEDYLNDGSETFNIDLLDLDLMFEEGELKVSLVYSENELISLTILLQDKVATENQTVEEVEKVEGLEEIIIENKTEEKEIVELKLSETHLTIEEREVLEQEFGEILIETIREEVENNKSIIGSQIGKYKIEHYYDYPQDKEVLKFQIKEDRIKWLKEIAIILLKEKIVPEPIDVVEDIYIINLTE